MEDVHHVPGPETKPSEALLFPCSSSQQRFWFINSLNLGNPALNIAVRLEIRGRFNHSTIEQAFQTIVDRHEILRTRFIDIDGEPVQEVAGHLDFHLSVVDLTAIPEEKRLDEAMALGRREAHVPFDIGQLPLIRVTLLRLSADHGFLLVTAHHIVFDAWSITILAREFGVIASALDAKHEHALPELPLQYGDYCLWQKAYLASAGFEAEIAYWKNKLAEAPYFEIVPDHERPAEPTSRSEILGAILAPALGDKLEATARKHNLTLFSFGCAVTAAMLHSYTGQTDVIFGTQIAGRDEVDLENLIGVFLDNLVLRFDASGDPTFTEFLARTNGTVQEALIHQRMPFHKLVELLNPPRDPQRTPLFLVNFTVFRDVVHPKRYGDFDLNSVPSLSSGPIYDLNFFVAHWPDGWRMALEFNSDLFERRSAKRMLEFLMATFEFAISNPDARLSSLVSPVRERIVSPKFGEDSTSNSTSRLRSTAVGKAASLPMAIERVLNRQAYSRTRTVDEYFSAEAQFAPGAPALLDGAATMSYRELDRRSNQFARYLQKLGVRPGDRAGLLAQRSSDTIVVFLGILKAGGAYVPLDTSYPRDLLAFMLEDCSPALTLAQREFVASGAFDRRPFVDMEEAFLAASAEDDAAVARAHEADNVAYVMYTSGSTGRPKGVLVPHRGITRLVKEQDYANFGPDECFLHMAPLAFDASTFEIWGALLNGGRLGIIRDPRPSFDDIRDAIVHYGVTTAWFTAGLFHLLVDHRLEDLRPLGRILAGGDVLSPAHVEKALAGLPNTQLVNGYGPTENTTFTCCYQIPREEWGGGAVPIGVPIAHTEVYLLGPGFEPVKDGEVGQLCVSGDGLSVGYLNRRELTNEKFIRHPFGKVPEDRLYLTGDLARRRPDGLIEFLGRTDRQIKINGKRVELDEIENTIRADPRIADAIVMLSEDLDEKVCKDIGQKRIVAYLKPAQALPAGMGQVFGDTAIAVLRTKLPEHMIPTDVVTLESFPLTPNGKVDRRQLPRPVGVPVSARALSKTEQTLAEIWRDVLQVPEIGPASNFFKLGGHSLLALRLVARVQSTLGIKIGVAGLFEAPTLQEFAARACRSETPLEPSSIAPIQPLGDKTPIIAINNTMIYYNLARKIGTDRPFLGVQVFDPRNPHSLIPRNMNEIAADYVRLIREAQPHGPYILFGLCVAGIIAYEAAQQLRQAGESVPLVVMADCWLPGYIKSLPFIRRFLWRWSYRLNSVKLKCGLVLSGKQSAAEFLVSFGLVRQSRIMDLAAALHLVSLAKPGKDDEAIRRFLLYLEDARDRYRASASVGDVVLLQSDEVVTRFADPKMKWSDLVKGRLFVHRVPGRHVDMFQEEGADRTAERLRSLLDQVDAERDQLVRSEALRA